MKTVFAGERTLSTVGLIGLLFLLLLTGCRSSDTKSDFVRRTVRDDVPGGGVPQARSFQFLDLFTKKVESTADRIIRATNEPEIKREALLWKIYGVPACMTAQDHSSPLAGLVNMWVLTLQMRDFFVSGGGKTVFGPHQQLAVTVSEELLAEADRTARYFLKPEGYEQAIERARAFAREHPLDTSYYGHSFGPEEIESVLSGADLSIFAMAQNLETEVIKLQLKLGRHANFLPRIARWQAELFAIDFM